jgi:hypothetical protein
MPKVISISGFIGSGKDTAADYLITNYGFKKLSFAGTLKDAVAATFNWDRELLDGATLESRHWRDQVDTWWANRLDMPNLTPRWVLQYWGTEVCRRGFHKDIWVAALENRLRHAAHDVVITDCRFQNEIDSIQNMGGTAIRISRGPKPIWYDDAVTFNQWPNSANSHMWLKVLQDNNVHASEYSGVGLAYDYYLTNDSTIYSLQRDIDVILNQLSSHHAAKSLLSA